MRYSFIAAVLSTAALLVSAAPIELDGTHMNNLKARHNPPPSHTRAFLHAEAKHDEHAGKAEWHSNKADQHISAQRSAMDRAETRPNSVKHYNQLMQEAVHHGRQADHHIDRADHHSRKAAEYKEDMRYHGSRIGIHVPRSIDELD
ncbi:SubName: Full=Uncharacterized protein {ECO:0000313/EMBL:CCA75733.1} [Serendipita indica DSM 11827]|nr:SubName: Full=Uncharacterized protein {ECO:0000313/EMBL:CCA75733.1} [Serendipita indica DSM 11827]